MVKLAGGDRLSAALSEIAAKASNAREVEIGFMPDKLYEDGTLVAMVAAVNEFGSGKTPPRPFFRGMIQDKSGEWPDAVANLLVDHDYDAKATLELTGQAIKGQLQEAIQEFNGVPLSPKTIERKGFSKQLIDSSTMLKSVDYNVK